MLKQFVQQCLFFGSRETLHLFLGALVWFFIGLFVYGVYNLVKLELA
jgi:hypothetical protein